MPLEAGIKLGPYEIIAPLSAGSTPSTLRLAPGEHRVTIQKAGFKSWQRAVGVSAGSNFALDATLEPSP